MFFRSAILSPQRLKSAQLFLNYSFDYVKDRSQCLFSVAAFQNKLLISCYIRDLYVYKFDNRRLSESKNFTIDDLFDVKWTPRGNIMYTALTKISVMSEKGKLKYSTEMKLPRYLSISNDDETIYVADHVTGVHKSIDEGFSWDSVIRMLGCWQVIYLPSRYGAIFWTFEALFGNEWAVYVYYMNITVSNNFTMTRNLVNLTTTEGKSFKVSAEYQSLSHDGYGHIFISDYGEFGTYAIHVFSETGEYKNQLISLFTRYNTYWCLSIDKKKQLLYVAHFDGVMKVFNLIYERGV